MIFRGKPPGPVLVSDNEAPDRSRTTFAERKVFNDLCTHLEKYENQGWEVHTVDRRHSGAHGDFYWVLLRRAGQPVSKLPTKA